MYICCNVVEDEFHFMFECPLFTCLRQAHLPKYYYKNPSMYKFQELMSTSNKSVQLKTSAFVYNSVGACVIPCKINVNFKFFVKFALVMIQGTQKKYVVNFSLQILVY